MRILKINGVKRSRRIAGPNRLRANRTFAGHANLTKLAIAIGAAAALPSHAFAQSSVTLYGIIDSGLGYVNNQGGKANVQATSGRLSGSRFGLRGVEALGDGYSAIFVLENGFSSQTGALQQGGRLFGRQAYVGVSHPTYGKLLFGRQYAPFELYVGYLTAGIRWGSSIMTDPFDLNMLGGSVRFNNAVTYESADYHGLTFSAQYAASNQAASQSGQGPANNREFGGAVRYVQDDVRAAIGYARLDHPNTSTNTSGATYGDYLSSFTSWFRQFDRNASGSSSSAALSVATQQVLSGGALVKFGRLQLASVLSRTLIGGLGISSANTSGFNTTNGRFDINSFETSASYDFAPDDTAGVLVKYSGAKLRTGSSNTSLHWWQVGVGNDYLLSKRTDIYVAATYERASGANNVAQVTLDAPSSNANQVAATIGFRHRF
jgi:GBP family porin